MVNLEENSTIISETTKLVKDISSLFLSEKFSDVTLILDNERFFAHKVRVIVLNTLLSTNSIAIRGIQLKIT